MKIQTRLPQPSIAKRTAPPAAASQPAASAFPVDGVQLSASAPPADVRAQATTAQASAAAAAAPLLGPAMYEGLKSGFVSDYMNPQEIYARCQELQKKYPDLVEIVERPYQTAGYDGKNKDIQGPSKLYYLRLGPKTADRDKKVGVFQFAAPHAREWVNPLIMLELTEQLLANYDPQSQDPAVRANTELLQKLDIYIAPQTNPDGTNYSMFDDPMWRKNRSRNEDGSSGVDINRNYPTGWVPGDDPSHITYPGRAPLSEPETRNIVGVLDDHPNIRFICDWHSYAEEIRKPWGVSEPDLKLYDELHTRMNDAMSTLRGRRYGQVYSEVVDGTSDDYFYHARQRYSMLVETARAFQPKREEALQVTAECTRAAREILRFAAEQGHLAQPSPPASIPPLQVGSA